MSFMMIFNTVFEHLHKLQSLMVVQMGPTIGDLNIQETNIHCQQPHIADVKRWK